MVDSFLVSTVILVWPLDECRMLAEAKVFHRLSTTIRRLVPAGTPLSVTRDRVYVHPCVIANRPHIVYPRGLQAQRPDLFEAIADYYGRRGFALKEDQRRYDAATPVARERRRRWVPMLVFTAGLLLEGVAYADTLGAASEVERHLEPRQVELKLSSNDAGDHSGGSSVLFSSAANRSGAVDPIAADRIYDLLRQRHEPGDADPRYLTDDFRQMANYYSSFPEVVAVFDSLKNKNWRLRYDEHRWQTVATGNVFHVDSATVHFNTRAAAQLKRYNQCENNPHCIASPADVLLHELLHVQGMLVHTREFIAQGGMSAVLYPYKHEYATIDAERKLYARMTQRDGISRPQRTDHVGRPAKAECPICIR